MAELKQIEVNGTTYDIGIPGSQLPVVCELYDASWSGETLADKMNYGRSDSDPYYVEVSSNILVKSVPDESGNTTLSVVIAIPDDALDIALSHDP